MKRQEERAWSCHQCFFLRTHQQLPPNTPGSTRLPVPLLMTHRIRKTKIGRNNLYQKVMLITNAVRRTRTKIFFSTVWWQKEINLSNVSWQTFNEMSKKSPQHQQVMLIANAVRRTRTKIFFRTVTAKRLQPVKCVLTDFQRDIKKIATAPAGHAHCKACKKDKNKDCFQYSVMAKRD